MALAGRRLGAPRSRCSFIGDEACSPQPPCALRVAAAWAHLGARRSSAMKEHRLRRVSADLGPWRSQRVPLRVLPWAAMKTFKDARRIKRFEHALRNPSIGVAARVVARSGD